MPGTGGGRDTTWHLHCFSETHRTDAKASAYDQPQLIDPMPSAPRAEWAIGPSHPIHTRNHPMLFSALRSCLLLAALLGGPGAYAQAPTETATPPTHPSPPTPPTPKALPADVTTHHTLELPGGELPARTLHFSATAGAIRLTDDKNAPRADIAFIAYQLDGA